MCFLLKTFLQLVPQRTGARIKNPAETGGLLVVISGSSEKFVGNFPGSLAQYSSVHTGMTKVVLFGNIC
uniref:Uncharacterized protein n=1 Tax=Candidatus Kentrum sp. LPFa TaxID=2126335 RepID=A0A450W8E6_9GAMM|nr:MAG: hypothetical protein BECKLPF1236B_GA0070989_104523 [Candidatus Kentron sp. LPFa]